MYLHELEPGAPVDGRLIDGLREGTTVGLRLKGGSPELDALEEVADKVLAISFEGPRLKVDWSVVRRFTNLRYIHSNGARLASAPLETFRSLMAIDAGVGSDLPEESLRKCRAMRFLRVMRPKWEDRVLDPGELRRMNKTGPHSLHAVCRSGRPSPRDKVDRSAPPSAQS